MARRTRILIVIGAAALLVVGGGLWWFFQDDAADRVSLEGAVGDLRTSTTGQPGVDGVTDDAAGGGDEPSGEGASGEWTVGAGSFAGYRIDEELTVGASTATARTDDVQGSLSIDGTTVTAVEVVVEMGSLSSTDGNGIRDGRVRSALETDRFATADFVLTEPVGLDAVPERGQPVTTTAVGELTLHGVTRTVEVAIEAQLEGETIVVVGSAPVLLSDHDIEAPTAARVLSVADEGELELQLIFDRA